MSNKTITILLVEDDEVDIEIVKRTFKKNDVTNPLSFATDGAAALEILRTEKNNPYLVFLDINMPGMGGIEFLEELRKDAELKDTVVFVLTSSDYDRDKAQAYQHNVAGYVLKSSFDENLKGLVSLIDYYQNHIEFPDKE